ncbi:hypothetical protein VCR31J2_1310639 [Vibrio coralliirubri]|uniref:Uncharacterized protein n=1 Tax=Vibrio coralliirubri TaxID=1516159 RepID=A0AA86XD91_9VIBR|nr:hypothetical protein VCR31J2_1310639 [Vibrio coralliirubri]
MLSNLLKSQVSVLWIHFLQVYSQLFELYKKTYSLCWREEAFIDHMVFRACVIACVIACEAPKLAGTIGFTMPVVCTFLIIFPEA